MKSYLVKIKTNFNVYSRVEKVLFLVLDLMHLFMRTVPGFILLRLGTFAILQLYSNNEKNINITFQKYLSLTSVKHT